jgi:hypothetical protein
MPVALKIDADQEFFHAGLDRAAVVVHGRRSHEGGPNAARRRRLVVTSRVGSARAGLPQSPPVEPKGRLAR